MALPVQVATKMKKRSVNSFGGYCHDQRAGAERFYDMKNLGGDDYPLLSTRAKRAEIGSLTKPNGLWAHANEKLCWADGTKLYYDGQEVGSVADSPKQFASMGSYVLIWPDKLKYDTQSGTLSPLGSSYSSSGTVTFGMCNLLGEAYTDYSAGSTAPSSPEGGDVWLDTSSVPNVLKRYSSITESWVSLSASYIRISAEGIGEGLSAYDGVSISGACVSSLNTSALVYAVQPNWILVAGTLEQSASQTDTLSISREIPDFDFICEHDNRIWGCSSARREIACCKLGDPGNWSCFMGISTDSYVLSVGSGGDFTACCAYGANVLIFKEDRILKLFGTKPENFQLSSTLCAGVAKLSQGSLSQAGGLLYYHSRGGVCAYGGALPDMTGEDLGEELFEAAGCACGEKYYLSAKNFDNVWKLFCFDIRTGLWYKEDNAHALAFAVCGGKAYMLRAEGTGAKLTVMRYSGEGSEEDGLSWMFETGELISAGYASPARISLRFEAEEGAEASLSLSYDGGGFERAGEFSAGRKRMLLIPLRLRRCDSLRLRAEGRGNMRLHAMSLIFGDGGEY